jgi:hypothetical protein
LPLSPHFCPFPQYDPRVRVRECFGERENELSWFLFFNEVTFLIQLVS